MKTNLYLLILITLISCNVPKNTTSAQSSDKKPIITGITNPKDYIDTFKLQSTFVKTVTVGKMEDSISIKAIDGSFDLKAGQQFTPTKFTEGWINPTKDFSRQFILSKGTKVELTYKDKKFYGVLEFNKVYNACAGDPSARSYYIKVPRSYLAAAMGGNTAVLYEYYSCAPRQGDEYKNIKDYTRKNQKYTSWVLWISDIPFE